MQLVIDGGTRFSITWQILPYVFLTLGEVLVSATGLEFAYSQAPLAMKGAIMSFWNLAVTVGNLWVAAGERQRARANGSRGASQDAGISVTAFLMFFFAVFRIRGGIRVPRLRAALSGDRQLPPCLTGWPTLYGGLHSSWSRSPGGVLEGSSRPKGAAVRRSPK